MNFHELTIQCYKPFMNLQPTLKNDRVILKPLQNDDFDKLFAVASDPLIWKLHPNSDRYKKEVFESFFQKGIDSKGAFLILDAESDDVMGTSRFYDFEPENKTIKIGYTFLARKYWGGSYNFEVKKLMIQHAFVSVEKVVFEVDENNHRSRKALEKIGAIHFNTYSLDGSNHCAYKIQKQDKNLFV